MSRDVPTSEALMTDPTTEEGRAFWAERHAAEERLEQAHDETCGLCVNHEFHQDCLTDPEHCDDEGWVE